VANRFRVSPKSERTLDNIVFASKREMMRYATLRLFEKAGKIRGLELQPEFQTFIAGKPFCRYTADFAYLVTTKDGREEKVIEDVKSTGTAKDAAYRLRKKAAELQYGFTVHEVTK
jgi:hypothetical protein